MIAKHIRQLATRISADVHLGRDADQREVTVHVELSTTRAKDVDHQRVLDALAALSDAMSIIARRSVAEAIAIETARNVARQAS